MRCFILFCCFVLTACADRTEAPIVPEALLSGTAQTVFVGTTRAQEGGVFGIQRSLQMNFLNLTVSLPPNRELGTISDGRDTPKPDRDFVLADIEAYPSERAFSAALRQELSSATSREAREVTVYVHGYNNSFTDAAFRMAQLSHDLELPGPVVSYSWPSRGNPLGYQYDVDSVSFARDGLAELLLAVQHAGASRIVLVGHSMGARLVMETLRQLELTKPGWAANAMAGVLLISPDVTVDVFRSQTAVFSKWPQPFVIFASKRDRLLRLSAFIRGEEERLGNLHDIDAVSDLPIAFIDVTAFDDGDDANHFVVGSSGSFLQLIKSSRDLDDAFLQGESGASVSVLGASRMIGRAVTVSVPAGDR